jgi:hypothetical protein
MEEDEDSQRQPFQQGRFVVPLKGTPLRETQEGEGFDFEKDDRQNRRHRNGILSGNLGSPPPRPSL